MSWFVFLLVGFNLGMKNCGKLKNFKFCNLELLSNKLHVLCVLRNRCNEDLRDEFYFNC